MNGDSVINGDKVFPTMVTSLLPIGIRGLVVAGLLAALMSSLSGLFNSCASLFTIDIYEKIRPNTPEKKLVLVGRIATGIVVILGILWIPVMPKISQGGLYKYLQSVQSYLAPPITAVFLLGLFWKRINAKGAFWTLAAGFILGMLKLTIQAFFGEGKIEHPQFLANIGDYNFLYFSGVLFVFCVAAVIIVSLVSRKQPEAVISGLTYSTTTEEDKRINRQSWNKWDVFYTAVILGFVIAVYLYFSFWLN